MGCKSRVSVGEKGQNSINILYAVYNVHVMRSNFDHRMFSDWNIQHRDLDNLHGKGVFTCIKMGTGI